MFRNLMLDQSFFLLLAIVATALSFTPAAQAKPQSYAIAPVPNWVEVRDESYPIHNSYISGFYGVQMLLRDVQLDVRKQKPRYYHHNVYHLTNAEGVDRMGSINLRSDPSYNTLTIHELVIVRDGKRLDKLKAANIMVLQQEEELHQRIYQGHETVHLLIPDLQVGDVLSMKFSRVGDNPAMQGDFFYELDTRWNIPIHEFRASLLWPDNKPVHFKELGTELKPEKQSRDGYTHYMWQADNVPAFLKEEDTPEWWLQSQDIIQISALNSWNAVATWGHTLYEPAAKVTPEIEALADTIRSEHSTKEQQMIAALRMVQQDIRYVSISLGDGGFIPRVPRETLKTRFGDCKDKSTLLLALLHALDINAQASLVNTESGKRLTEILPSKRVFDHAIVKATIDGKHYWLDGTLTYQRGNADHLHTPDYGPALVLSPETNALENMNTNAVITKPLEAIEEIFIVPEIDKTGTLRVTTQFRGTKAMRMRAKLAANKEKLQQNYLKFYSDYFPDIEVKKALEVKDCEKEDVLSIYEQYTIAKPWKLSQKKDKYYFFVTGDLLGSKLDAPHIIKRNAPVEQRHPVYTTHTARTMLPHAPKWWAKLDEGSESIANDFFTASRHESVEENTWWVVESSIKTLTDTIPADQTKSYRQAAEEMDNLFEEDYINYNPDAVAEAAKPKWKKSLAQFKNNLPYLGLFIGLWVWFYLRARAGSDHPATLFVPNIRYEHHYNASPKQVWNTLVQFKDLTQKASISLLKQGAGDEQEVKWKPEDLREGVTLLHKGSIWFGWFSFAHRYHVEKCVPNELLVLRMDEQPMFENASGANGQIRTQQVKHISLTLTDGGKTCYMIEHNYTVTGPLKFICRFFNLPNNMTKLHEEQAKRVERQLKEFIL